MRCAWCGARLVDAAGELRFELSGPAGRWEYVCLGGCPLPRVEPARLVARYSRYGDFTRPLATVRAPVLAGGRRA